MLSTTISTKQIQLVSIFAELRVAQRSELVCEMFAVQNQTGNSQA